MQRRPAAFLGVCLLVGGLGLAPGCSGPAKRATEEGQAAIAFAVRPDGGGWSVLAGEERLGSIVPFQHERISATDSVAAEEQGVFVWTRTFRCPAGGGAPVPARLVMDLATAFEPVHTVIPAVSYDGNVWGTGGEPKGYATADGPWTFAYHRTAIPGATYSESERFSIGLFSRPGQIGCGLACSLMPSAGGGITHRLVWPEEETPRLYSNRDAYSEPYREELTLAPGQEVALQAWIVADTVAPERRGWRRLLDTAFRMGLHEVAPSFGPAELWALGVTFAKESLWAEEGPFRGFSIGLWREEDRWIQRPAWKYEIGWAGQNSSLANALLEDFLKTEDRSSLERGLTCLDTWLAHARLDNGLFRCHFDYVLGLCEADSEVQDACNLGHAAQGYFEAFELAERCGVKRPAYREAAFAICDFAVEAQQADGRFGKTWRNDGSVADPEGTIGAFLIPPLVTAYETSGKRHYLDAAVRAYDAYIREFLANGYTTAGALDTYCVDKESATPLLKAGLRLYDATEDPRYVALAEEVSYYLATWQWHESTPFPAGSILAGMGYDTFGGTSVSTQHHHQDPYALIIVNDWLRLAELTGRPIWRERALAAWANGTAGISDGRAPIAGNLRPAGGQDEGFFHTRWGNPFSVSQWLVAWPTAFRLETLRKAASWEDFR